MSSCAGLMAWLWRLDLTALIQVAASWDWSTFLAALVGVLGYVIDGRTSRQTELRAVQVARAQAQFAELLTPLNITFQSMLHSLYTFVGTHLDADDATEFTSPDCVLRQQAVRWVWSDDDGLMQMRRPGGQPAATAYELPERLVARIASDPNLFKAYRCWVQHEWCPAVEAIAHQISASSHLMETIPSWRLRELYGPETPTGASDWDYTPRGLFLSWCEACAACLHGDLRAGGSPTPAPGGASSLAGTMATLPRSDRPSPFPSESTSTLSRDRRSSATSRGNSPASLKCTEVEAPVSTASGRLRSALSPYAQWKTANPRSRLAP